MQKTLTPVELEIMSHLWKLKEGTVSDLLAALPAERQLAYTSVSTMLRILEQKEIVGARKAGRGHSYFPKLSKKDYEASSVQKLVAQVFEGAPVALVRQLLDASSISEADLLALRRLLDEKIQNEKNK
jgi:predicted transcriptional regulator